MRSRRDAIAEAGLEAARIAAIGITNQRESVVLWERASGRPVHRVIVWQDRRTTERCRALSAAGHDALVRERTGLVIDPYFSATKLAWLLDEIDGVRAAAERGELAFGTIDSFLLWRLTGGAVHATDASNAARTMLYDIHRQDWDDDLLELLRDSARDPAGGQGLQRAVRHHAGRAARRAAADHGDRRRSAGGDRGSGVLSRRACSRAPTAPAASRS